MVKKRQGQSMIEFLVIMAALTTLGFFLAMEMWPSSGNTGAIYNAQSNASQKIGND
jgi:hypothetical protein